jgi:RNA polymerase sigma-70 factor (ECF subfamily)
MSSSPRTNVNYRALYGKLFSGLLHHFGIKYVSEIEDAIQNTFLKSLKVWKQGNLPNHKENWLYIVARNDIVNQIKKRKESSYQPYFSIEEP